MLLGISSSATNTGMLMNRAPGVTLSEHAVVKLSGISAGSSDRHMSTTKCTFFSQFMANEKQV